MIETDLQDVLLISVKPQFAKKIFEGGKTIELRKSAPRRAGRDNYLLVYVTSPVKELWGACRIGRIIQEEPTLLWENSGNKTGISKKEFFNYYKSSEKAFGIELHDISVLKNKLTLEALRAIFPDFTPPQTYRYMSLDSDQSLFLKKLFE